MHHIAICGLPGSTIFFHIFSLTVRFSGKETEHKICVLISLQLLSETCLVLRRGERYIILNYIRLHVKYQLFLSDFN